jgi:hypothetical protein
MVKFRYTGDSANVSVGVAGALFHKGVVNEVPDERLAALLRTTPGFEEVSVDQLPAVTSAILHAPTQGALHPDPEVAEFIRQKHLLGSKHKKLEGVTSPGDGLGQISRGDQYEANVDALVEAQGEASSKKSKKGEG